MALGTLRQVKAGDAFRRLRDGELCVWRAQLDLDEWPSADCLPLEERERAARVLHPLARRRWVAARWALRSVLSCYLDEDPAEIELRLGRHGKPMLAPSPLPLHFNLSHSADRALVAISGEREVGVDIERIGARPSAFYAAWTRREAIAKCFGTGLAAPLPEGVAPAVFALDAGPGFAAALAVNDTR